MIKLKKPRGKRWRSEHTDTLKLAKLINETTAKPIRHNVLLARYKKKFGSEYIYTGTYTSGRNTKRVVEYATLNTHEAKWLLQNYPAALAKLEEDIAEQYTRITKQVDELMACFFGNHTR